MLYQVEFAALEGKVGSHETPQTYNYNKVKRQKVEDLNVDKGYITGESHVELDGDPSRVQVRVLCS